jgi:hypothetical protein
MFRVVDQRLGEKKRGFGIGRKAGILIRGDSEEGFKLGGTVDGRDGQGDIVALGRVIASKAESLVCEEMRFGKPVHGSELQQK